MLVQVPHGPRDGALHRGQCFVRVRDVCAGRPRTRSIGEHLRGLQSTVQFTKTYVVTSDDHARSVRVQSLFHSGGHSRGYKFVKSVAPMITAIESSQIYLVLFVCVSSLGIVSSRRCRMQVRIYFCVAHMLACCIRFVSVEVIQVESCSKL